MTKFGPLKLQAVRQVWIDDGNSRRYCNRKARIVKRMFRWGFFAPEQVDEYLYASGKPLRASDVALLERYDKLIAGEYCEPHCGVCLGTCPEQLAIDDVMRHRMYFEDYGREKYAMELYSRLERQADVCVGCAAPCTGSCPYGISIQERAIETHELLTLG